MRIVGVVLILGGLYVAVVFGLDWRSFLQPEASLCGCEFDAAVRLHGMLTFLSACLIAVLTVMSGVLLIRRYGRPLLVLAVWFIGIASLPWVDRIVPFPYPVESNTPSDPVPLAWTAVCMLIGVACLIFHRIKPSPN